MLGFQGDCPKIQCVWPEQVSSPLSSYWTRIVNQQADSAPGGWTGQGADDTGLHDPLAQTYAEGAEVTYLEMSELLDGFNHFHKQQWSQDWPMSFDIKTQCSPSFQSRKWTGCPNMSSCNIDVICISHWSIYCRFISIISLQVHVFDAGDLLQEASTSSCARGTSIRRQGHVDNGCALEKTRRMFSRTVHQIDGRCTRSFYWWSSLASIFVRNLHIKCGTGSFFRIPLLYFFVS